MPLVDPAAWDLLHLRASASPPPPRPPKTHVRPTRIHIPDRELDTTRVRGVGFRAGDDQGWRGKIRKTYAEAREDAREHRREAR